jgi:hypothetical protein
VGGQALETTADLSGLSLPDPALSLDCIFPVSIAVKESRSFAALVELHLGHKREEGTAEHNRFRRVGDKNIHLSCDFQSRSSLFFLT